MEKRLVYLSLGESDLWKRERHFFFSSANWNRISCMRLNYMNYMVIDKLWQSVMLWNSTRFTNYIYVMNSHHDYTEHDTPPPNPQDQENYHLHHDESMVPHHP